jgi:predicted deacylase
MKHRLALSIAIVIVLAGFLSGAAPAAGQDKSFGPVRANPGEIKSGHLQVPGPDGGAASIPVTVIRGLKDGPTLALVAGVHGYEYPPILALYRLKTMVDPKTLSGTLVLVHIANPPSFRARTIYYNPFDGKNLNRVFPGDPNGTLSQRMARVLTNEVVEKCDALIDMHCGDGNEALMLYSYWMISPRADLNERTKAMALAFGLRHIIIDDTRGPDPADSKYLGNTALTRGIPAVTTEAGMLGRTDEDSIARNVQGSLNVMKLLKMLEGRPPVLENPVWIDKYEVAASGHDGLFAPAVGLGAMVEAGQLVGVVRNDLGEIVEELKAPFAGIILYIINTPPANKGEPLFEVGRIKT